MRIRRKKGRKPLGHIKRRGGGLKRATGHFKPRRRRKKGELTLAKEKLWDITRLLVFKTYGSHCFTCNKKHLTGTNRHGGHVPWASSELSSICKTDIRYIRAQCYDCNINKNGRGAEAFKKMVLSGIDVEEMWRYNLETKGKVFALEQVQERTKEYIKLLKA